MGKFGLRRVVTAGHPSRVFELCCLTLLLLAPLASPADEVADDELSPLEVPAPVDEAVVGADPDADEAAPRKVGSVTVTATRAERDVLEVPGHVTVIEREQIDRSGVRSVPELLRRQSGLFVTNTTTNPAGYTVDARGFNNGGGNGGNLLVQVDGRRVNEADLGVADWALIPLDMIESIEIVRGSSSAMYGDNAAGGVINIRTRPREGPPRATVRGSYGRYDTGGGSLLAAASVGSATGSLFISGRTTDGYRDSSGFDDRNYDGSLEWNFGDRVLVGASGGYHEDHRDFPGSLTRFQLATLGRRAASPNSLGNDSALKRGVVQGWVEAIVAEDVELRLRPYYRDLDDDATITASFFGLTTTTRIEAEKRAGGVDVQLQVDRDLFGRENRLIVGFEFLHEEVDRAVQDDFFPNTSNNDRDVYGVFVQEELYLTETLLLAAGVRFDRASLDLAVFRPLDDAYSFDDPRYSEWSPKASITWLARPGFSVYVSYARGFRLPTLDEASPLFGTIPGLDAQVSDAGEIGAKLRGERIEGSLALYYMRVEDEILFDPITFSNENLDRVRHRGVEAVVAFQVASWLSFHGSYTFDDVEIREAVDPILEGARMPITPKHRGTLGLVATLPYDLEFDATANIVGERIRANDFDRRIAELDSYGTLDLLFAWRPSFGEHLRASFSFGLSNVTNEKYEGFGARDDFNPDSGALEPTAFFYPAARRTWEVAVMFSVRR